jgi:hypothetical protein
MPVQTLMQDLLRNGIDYGSLSSQGQVFRHSSSVIFKSKNPNLDKDAIM